MKKYRVLAALLCAAICFSMTACFKKEKPIPDDGMSGVISGEGGLGPADKIEITPNTHESEPETESEPDAEALSPYSPGQNELPGKENMSGEFEKLAGLPCDQVPWGPGTNFDADGRPTACTALQSSTAATARTSSAPARSLKIRSISPSTRATKTATPAQSSTF